MSSPTLEATKLNKSFGDLHVLKGVNITIDSDEVVTLVGPSGSGKSTLLRCLNLLDFPDSGELRWRGDTVPFESLHKKALLEHRRRMGMVFQHFNLFPHRTARENVMEGPVQVLGTPTAEAREETQILLERVGLGDKGDAWPDQLSGGQKQRVAIARALAMKPEALLLDEITSALDVEMIAGINELLAELAGQGMTMIAVTHDLTFARRVADRMVFMDEGQIIEEGHPGQLLEAPKSERLQKFLSAVTQQPGPAR